MSSPAEEKAAGSRVTRPVHSIPIAQRASPSRVRSGILFALFTLLLLGMHLSQLVLWPMSLVPGGLRESYWQYITFSKESFTRTLVWISRKTTFVITVDDSIDLEKIVERDANGSFKAFKFPARTIWLSNHQMYVDWIFAWVFFYFADLHGAMVIVLKASLRRVPIGGPAMRLWDFIFLSGSWESDEEKTGMTLTTLGRRSTKHEKPLALLLYPEGTLVSALTRPRSAKFAVKQGIASSRPVFKRAALTPFMSLQPDMKNMLLPRSTGLLYCLRTLMPVAPDLAMYDMTIGYPGLPAGGYAQSYYTLTSVYAAGQAPPTVHIHIRALPISTAPTGATLAGGKFLSPSETNAAVTPEERQVFDGWLRDRWTEKDELLSEYYRAGEFAAGKGQRMEVKIGLRGIDDWLAVAANFVPLYVGYRVAVLAYANLF